VNAFLQRWPPARDRAIPKGACFRSRSTTDECTALLDAVRRGELDCIHVRTALDVLAQQVIAEVACREWDLDALYECLRRAAPYRELTLAEFEPVVQMLADGYATRAAGAAPICTTTRSTACCARAAARLAR